MLKYKFILLNNSKNEKSQFSSYELKNNPNINNENIIKVFLVLLLMINVYSFYHCNLMFEESENENFQNDLKLTN